MVTKKLPSVLFIISLLILLLPAGLMAQTRSADEITVPDEWADTYTAEEIAAIERALWAGNFTLEDLNFRKDYAYGYACFPIVKEWMVSPMDIAPGVDKIIKEINEPVQDFAEPFNTLNTAIQYYAGESGGETGIEAFAPGSVDYEFLVTSTDDVATMLQIMLRDDLTWSWEGENADIIRQFGPYQMAWHDVFESPYTAEQVSTWQAEIDNQPDEYLYQLMEETSVQELMRNYFLACPDPRGWLDQIPLTAFPYLTPKIIETDSGRIGIGSRGDDYWEGDFVILIDPSGDDTYKKHKYNSGGGDSGRGGVL